MTGALGAAGLSHLGGDAPEPRSRRRLWGKAESLGRRAGSGRKQMAAQRCPLSNCGFNRSVQHLISSYREKDVEDEAAPEDLLQ